MNDAGSSEVQQSLQRLRMMYRHTGEVSRPSVY
jgi:hypothetical protein